MASALSLFVVLSWFFSVEESRRFNRQSQFYLSERFSVLYRHIQLYLTEDLSPSFSHLQKIISFYSPLASDFLNLSNSKEDKSSKKQNFNFPVSGIEPDTPLLSVIESSGLVLAHSEPHYRGKKLLRSNPVLSLIQQYPKGWNLINNHPPRPVITSARPIVVSSKKYFLVASQQALKPGDFFLSYLTKVLWFGLSAGGFLFLMLFLYLRSFAQATHFLFRLLGRKNFLLNSPPAKFSEKPFPLKVLKEKERKKALSHLVRTKNVYLKSIYPGLISVLKKDQKRPKESILKELSFSDIVHKAIHQSRLVYPDWQITKELNADIKLPVFADKLFQVLWELIKNSVQAFPQKPAEKLDSGDPSKEKDPSPKSLKICTYKKQHKWFCCEIEDKGPGMKKATMEQAFALHWTTKKGFTGLGLPFVQSVLSRIGGVIKLKSSEKGGLTVCLFIPLDYIIHIQYLKEQTKGIENQDLQIRV